mgnify:FL=1
MSFMIERKGSFYLGVFVFVIPFLGFPTMWKMILVVIAGFSLVMISIRIPSPRKNFRTKIKKENSPQPSEVVVSEIINEPRVSEPVVTEAIKEPKIEIVVPKRAKRSTAKVASSRKIIVE